MKRVLMAFIYSIFLQRIYAGKIAFARVNVLGGDKLWAQKFKKFGVFLPIKTAKPSF
jgi:hypothetical protein